MTSATTRTSAAPNTARSWSFVVRVGVVGVRGLAALERPHIMPAASRRERNILVRVLVSYRRWLLCRDSAKRNRLRSASGW